MVSVSPALAASVSVSRRHRLAELTARRDPQLRPARSNAALNFLLRTRSRAVKDRLLFLVSDQVRHPQKLDSELGRERARDSGRARQVQHKEMLVLEKELMHPSIHDGEDSTSDCKKILPIMHCYSWPHVCACKQ